MPANNDSAYAIDERISIPEADGSVSKLVIFPVPVVISPTKHQKNRNLICRKRGEFPPLKSSENHAGFSGNRQQSVK
jgi:hypothetical protein